MALRRTFAAYFALAASLLAVCFFAGLGAIGLVGPDEPRYAWIARAMAQSGDWTTPRLWGHPWFEKPILYYWSAAVSFRLFGVTARAARLPDALAAFCGALLLAWAAHRIWNRRAAFLTLLLFPTSLGIFAFAHAATMDMLLTVSVEAAMIAALATLWPRPEGQGFSRAEHAAQSSRLQPLKSASADKNSPAHPPDDPSAPAVSRWNYALVGAFIGLGTLAKGPVAIILAGGSVLLWAVFTRRWRLAIRFLRWESLLAFAVVALPWYIACSLANPHFAYTFFWYQNFQRFLTPVFEHVQPWWFFIPILALALVPWTPILIATARDLWRTVRSGDASRSPQLFLAAWAAFPLLFFSFSDSKLPGYILPSLPPLVLLLAGTLDRMSSCSPINRQFERIGSPATEASPDALSPGGPAVPSPPSSKTSHTERSEGSAVRTPASPRDTLGRATLALVGALWIALGTTAGHWLRRLPSAWDVSHHAAIAGFLWTTAVVGLLIVVLAFAARNPLRSAVLSAVWMGVLVAAVSWFFLPRVSRYLSARDAARRVSRSLPLGGKLETYRLSRDWVYGLDFYLGRELTEWSPSVTHPAWICTTRKALAALPHSAAVASEVVPLAGPLVLARVTPPAHHP